MHQVVVPAAQGQQVREVGRPPIPLALEDVVDLTVGEPHRCGRCARGADRRGMASRLGEQGVDVVRAAVHGEHADRRRRGVVA
jgi:hypothetical protein